MMLYENGKMCFQPSLLKGVNLIVKAIEWDHQKDFYEEEQIENVFILISIVTQSI